MKIGDKITKSIAWFELSSQHGRTKYTQATGEVVYIHPRGRYYTLRFDFPGGSLRESFKT